MQDRRVEKKGRGSNRIRSSRECAWGSKFLTDWASCGIGPGISNQPGGSTFLSLVTITVLLTSAVLLVGDLYRELIAMCIAAGDGVRYYYYSISSHEIANGS